MVDDTKLKNTITAILDAEKLGRKDVAVAIYEGKHNGKLVAQYRGDQTIYGASVPKLALVYSVYHLLNKLKSMKRKASIYSMDINELEREYVKVYKNSTKPLPKISAIYETGYGDVHINTKTKEALLDLNCNRLVSELMLKLGGSIYDALLSKKLQDVVALNQTYRNTPKQNCSYPYKKRILPNGKCHNITANGIAELYTHLLENDYLKGIAFLKNQCFVGDDKIKAMALYRKCGYFSKWWHDTWVYKKNGKRYIVCYLTEGIGLKIAKAPHVYRVTSRSNYIYDKLQLEIDDLIK